MGKFGVYILFAPSGLVDSQKDSYTLNKTYYHGPGHWIVCDNKVFDNEVTLSGKVVAMDELTSEALTDLTGPNRVGLNGGLRVLAFDEVS